MLLLLVLGWPYVTSLNPLQLSDLVGTKNCLNGAEGGADVSMADVKGTTSLWAKDSDGLSHLSWVSQRLLKKVVGTFEAEH